MEFPIEVEMNGQTYRILGFTIHGHVAGVRSAIC